MNLWRIEHIFELEKNEDVATAVAQAIEEGFKNNCTIKIIKDGNPIFTLNKSLMGSDEERRIDLTIQALSKFGNMRFDEGASPTLTKTK